MSQRACGRSQAGATMPNQEYVFAVRPAGAPDDTTFELRDCAMPVAEQGEIVVEASYFSVDPYMRGRLSAAKSYAAGWKLGEPGSGGVTGIVVESKAAGFAIGDAVVGSGPWRRMFAARAAGFRLMDPCVPATAHLGVIGGTGLSAYLPLKHIGKPQPGETVFVSGAAGAVGSVACQIALLMGCTVVGSAGTDDKVAWLQSLGVSAFNYRTSPIGPALAKLCPQGIDVYFDVSVTHLVYPYRCVAVSRRTRVLCVRPLQNVGGEMLDAALDLMNTYGRIIACGGISQYNAKDASEICMCLLPGPKIVHRVH